MLPGQRNQGPPLLEEIEPGQNRSKQINTMGGRRKRPDRLELRLTKDEKSMIVACAGATGQTCNEFVLSATKIQMNKLKIKLARPQIDMFAKKPGEQTELF